jgi:hypothetical protein
VDFFTDNVIIEQQNNISCVLHFAAALLITV